jgi:hypothetical protein
MPASAADINVMINTAARVEINQREMISNASHSALSIRGMTLKAFNHILAFIFNPLPKK